MGGQSFTYRANPHRALGALVTIQQAILIQVSLVAFKSVNMPQVNAAEHFSSSSPGIGKASHQGGVL